MIKERIVVNSEEYGETVWPSMGMLRGYADWCVRWDGAENNKSEKTPHYFLDVGGGGGAFTLVCKRVWPDAHMTILEPSPDMLPYLRENIEGLDNVEILTYGASNKERTLFLSNPDDAHRGSPLGRQSLHGTGEDAREIKCFPLDDLIDTPVHIMKIDVETHEVECLEGATRILKEERPDIIIEVRGSMRGTEFDPRPMLERMGYAYIGFTGQDFWYTWGRGTDG